MHSAMIVFLMSITTWISAWFVHLILWHVHLPKAQIKMLLAVFFFGWCAAIVLTTTTNWGFYGSGEGIALFGFLYFSLLYWSAALCYVITYSAMEGDSPTLSLARYLHRKGDKGVCHEEVEEFFRQRPFIGARVRALVTDRILIEESNGYRLRSGKYLFFHAILLYRRMVFGRVSSGG